MKTFGLIIGRALGLAIIWAISVLLLALLVLAVVKTIAAI